MELWAESSRKQFEKLAEIKTDKNFNADQMKAYKELKKYLRKTYNLCFEDNEIVENLR